MAHERGSKHSIGALKLQLLTNWAKKTAFGAIGDLAVRDDTGRWRFLTGEMSRSIVWAGWRAVFFKIFELFLSHLHDRGRGLSPSPNLFATAAAAAAGDVASDSDCCRASSVSLPRAWLRRSSRRAGGMSAAGARVARPSRVSLASVCSEGGDRSRAGTCRLVTLRGRPSPRATHLCRRPRRAATGVFAAVVADGPAYDLNGYATIDARLGSACSHGLAAACPRSAARRSPSWRPCHASLAAGRPATTTRRRFPVTSRRSWTSKRAPPRRRGANDADAARAITFASAIVAARCPAVAKSRPAIAQSAGARSVGASRTSRRSVGAYARPCSAAARDARRRYARTPPRATLCTGRLPQRTSRWRRCAMTSPSWRRLSRRRARATPCTPGARGSCSRSGLC